MKIEAAIAIADALPDVTVGAKWGNKTWMVENRGFLWQRPLGKADLTRFGDETPPHGDIIAVIVDDLDAKDALLAMDLPGFFTIQHFNGYAAVLIELRLARTADVRAAIEDAHRVAIVKGPPKTRPKKPRAKKPKAPAKRSR